MKSIFAFLILSALSKGLAAQKPNCNHYKQELHFKSSELENMRSDTLDILNYHIELDISNIASRAISGSCTIDFQPKMDGVSSISLDLLGFTVDSIIQNGAPLSYSYNDTLLVAELDGIYDLGERSAIRVYYRGTPSIDPSGWGGFYMQSGYAFNLGVGFESYPHNFGRAWFPCFDNFVERSTYSFNIITAAGEIAACNGHLANRYNLPSGKVANEWIMEDKIPTYLACVAVSSYSTVHLSHAGKEKDIPIEIYALSNDTSAVKSSFANLGPAVDAFENAFGPYRWEKIGYSMVPFNSGAMEHATNIAYPRTSGVGGLGSETLMAHELAHSWWGNLATCHKAEEMWINEGMASYCESLFLEHVYGRGEYEEDVASRHLYVLRYPHHLEDGFWALDSVPLKHTYGDHVYRKGADIAHTLRGYLGDELFFSSMSEFLNRHRFESVSSRDLMTELSAISEVDLTPFFSNWVMNPGFPQFETREMSSTPNGNNFDVELSVKQKLKGAPEFYSQVPLDVTFMDEDWNSHEEKIMMSGEDMTFNFSLPFKPVYATLDFNNLISDAISSDKVLIKNPGIYQMPNALMTIFVQDPVDSAFIRVEHMWTAPDPIQDPDSMYQLSKSRYFRVDGIIPEGFDGSMQIPFDGRKGSGSFGWLDHDLAGPTRDTLRVFYRAEPSDNWEEFPYYRKTARISESFASGSVRIDTLLKGEYCFGKLKSTTFIAEFEQSSGEEKLEIFPNPNDGSFSIKMEQATRGTQILRVYDAAGRLMDSKNIPTGTREYKYDSELPSGNYYVQIQGKEKIRKGGFVVQ